MALIGSATHSYSLAIIQYTTEIGRGSAITRTLDTSAEQPHQTFRPMMRQQRKECCVHNAENRSLESGIAVEFHFAGQDGKVRQPLYGRQETVPTLPSERIINP